MATMHSWIVGIAFSTILIFGVYAEVAPDLAEVWNACHKIHPISETTFGLSHKELLDKLDVNNETQACFVQCLLQKTDMVNGSTFNIDLIVEKIDAYPSIQPKKYVRTFRGLILFDKEGFTKDITDCTVQSEENECKKIFKSSLCMEIILEQGRNQTPVEHPGDADSR